MGKIPEWVHREQGEVLLLKVMSGKKGCQQLSESLLPGLTLTLLLGTTTKNKSLKNGASKE